MKTVNSYLLERKPGRWEMNKLQALIIISFFSCGSTRNLIGHGKIPRNVLHVGFTVFIVPPLRVATVHCIMACQITVKLHKWTCVQPFDSQHVQILNEMLNFLKQK